MLGEWIDGVQVLEAQGALPADPQFVLVKMRPLLNEPPRARWQCPRKDLGAVERNLRPILAIPRVEVSQTGIDGDSEIGSDQGSPLNPVRLKAYSTKFL